MRINRATATLFAVYLLVHAMSDIGRFFEAQPCVEGVSWVAAPVVMGLFAVVLLITSIFGKEE